MKTLIFSAALTLTLTACSSGNLASSAPTCASMDWFEKGRQDGVSGSESKAKHIKESCGSSFDEQALMLYSNGHNAGTVEYCSPANAFKLGQMGVHARFPCPAMMKPEFEAGFKRGEESRKLKAQNEALAQKIEALSQQVHSRGLASEDHSVTSQLEQLKKLYAQNEKKLSKIRN